MRMEEEVRVRAGRPESTGVVLIAFAEAYPDERGVGGGGVCIDIECARDGTYDRFAGQPCGGKETRGDEAGSRPGVCGLVVVGERGGGGVLC